MALSKLNHRYIRLAYSSSVSLPSCFAHSFYVFFSLFKQGVSKGLVVEKVISKLTDDGKQQDFLMCIGDDRSDEDMFESLLKSLNPSSAKLPEIFCCTVGQKPSKAKYYLDDTADVLRLLSGIASAASNQKPRYNPHAQVSFESTF